uniref:UPAR/Ly6 domain-containing protein n=1 Tax=Mastacembelus armatus TaxID=205130 RepID=A0A7N8Y8V9_9TELE
MTGNKYLIYLFVITVSCLQSNCHVLLFTTEFSYYKQCMRQADAFIVSTWSHHQVFTCNTDRCN